MKKTIMTLLFTAIVLAAAGQHVVTGKMVSNKDKQPLMYANVAMLRAEDSTFVRGTVTDEKGVFSLKNDTVPTVLRLSAMGYGTIFVAVPNTRYGGPTGLGTIDMGTIELSEGAMLLDMIKIVDTRPLYAVDGEKDLYNVAEDATIQTGNASDALQNAPGVEVDVEGNVTLNGATATVWINDRPSNLEGEALKQYIKTLPANSIDRIEVIRNPSARYGSNGPVVNIVTNQRMMRNSFVSFGANGTSRPSISPWASYVFSNEKLHISAYLSYSGANNTTIESQSGHMMHNTIDTARIWSTSGTDISRRNNIWGNLNASYEFDSMNSINGWFGAYPGWRRSNESDTTIRTDFMLPNLDPANFNYITQSKANSFNHGGYGGLWYTHKFNNEGHQYSISTNGSWWGWKNQSSDLRHYERQTQLNYDQNSNSNQMSGNGSLSFNYSLPYSKNGEIEAGVELGLGRDFHYKLRDTLTADNVWRTDLLRSDSARDNRQSAEAYLTWRRKWGGFSLKLGMRLNYSHSTSKHLYKPQYDVDTHSWAPVPSIHLSYSTKSMHNFSLSYVMRTDHPDASEYSTYEDYGIESFSTGNPLLQPIYNHNVDFSWNKFFTKFGSVGVNSSFRSKINEYSILTDARYVDFFGRVVTYSKPNNVGDTRRFDLNFNIMYRPSALFNVRLSGGFAYGWYRLQLRPNENPVENGVPSWNARIRVWTKLWNKVEVFASGDYSSRGLSAWSLMSLDEPRKGLNLGASADFFDRKLSLYLNCNDIFNWNSWNTTELNPYNSSTSNYKWTSRYISFGLTLRFGKMELESRAKTGATEDTSR